MDLESQQSDRVEAIAKIAQDLAVKTDLNNAHLNESITKLSESSVRLQTSFEFMQKDLAEIKINLYNKFVTTEVFNQMLATGKDHEKRIRHLETHVWIAIGAISIVTLVLKFLIK